MSSISLTPDQLDHITEYGKAFFSPDEVELIMEIDGLAKNLQIINSTSYRAYQKGLLTSMFAVRKNIVKMAENGSSPAQTQIEKLFDKIKFDGIN
mgnify:CR=1 FL=1